MADAPQAAYGSSHHAEDVRSRVLVRRAQSAIGSSSLKAAAELVAHQFGGRDHPDAIRAVRYIDYAYPRDAALAADLFTVAARLIRTSNANWTDS